MNKELFVSSTPHETKVGLVEDDLLAEIYLERENEYTLAGSIYKGRVTRVLPGMQSAFVDIGLERDAFLYVSDFMELEEHDEDVTDVVPAGRGVPDMRPQPVQTRSCSRICRAGQTHEEGAARILEGRFCIRRSSRGAKNSRAAIAWLQSRAGQEPSAGFSEPGSWRLPRTPSSPWRTARWRTAAARAGVMKFVAKPERGRSDSSRDSRGPDNRFTRPAAEVVPRAPEPARTQQFGPPAGYQPILLPGESISKYQRMARPACSEPVPETVTAHPEEDSTTSEFSQAAVPEPSVEEEPVFAEATLKRGKSFPKRK